MQIEAVDLFCGAGGTTAGFDRARWRGKPVVNVLACVNHDAGAIRSHAANHPHCQHFTEDIRLLNVARLPRKRPGVPFLLWASLECTHFSKAKSGPKNADSRSLADFMPRYIEHCRPDWFIVENVEEFQSWGALDANGRPVSRKEGTDYFRWRTEIERMGYRYQSRILNSADYGAHTSRSRYFAIFTRHGMPCAFPEPTHDRSGRFGLPKWRAVREVLDLKDTGGSIFARKTPLVEKTLRRILNGLKKFVQPDQLLMTCNTPGFCSSLAQPSGTITQRGHKALVTPVLMTYYGNGNCSNVERPSPTLTTRDRIGLVTPVHFLEQFFSGSNGQSADVPAWALTTSNKAALATAWVVNPQFGNKGSSVEQPAPVVIAQQRSMPLQLATAVFGQANWQPQPDDSETMRELRAVMQEKGIADICLRMLTVAELKRVQGFGSNYHLEGTQTDQKKYIGNAVVPIVAQRIAEALWAEFCGDFQRPAVGLFSQAAPRLGGVVAQV